MPRGISIMDLFSTRFLRHREEARNDLRKKTVAIKRSAEPLAGDDAERPFMIPRCHDPYVIWDYILNFITDPEEIMTLWEVSPLFREILNSQPNATKYIQSRLPQVLQIILEKRPQFLLESGEEERQVFVGWRIKYIPPQSTKTLLNLRIISPLCKNSVEEQLHPAGPSAEKLYLTLETREQVQTMIRKIVGREFMADSFFPPNLKVYEGRFWDNRQQGVAFSEDVRLLLALIGKRVKSFAYASNDSAQGAYDKLTKWVLQMPNLKHLGMRPIRCGGYYVYGVPLFPPSFEELTPFPNCPQLRSLTQWKILPKPYLQRILDANPLIKLMSLPYPDEKYPDPSDMIFTLQNLESLHAPLYGSILNFLGLQCPLKEIVLQVGFQTTRSVSTKELFPFLNQFQDSLEHLDLHGVYVKKTGRHFLDLPHLKFFKWRYFKSFKDLDFLLHAERLEELDTVVRKTVSNRQSFLHSFFKDVTNGFDGLSVWDVFPRLQKVLVEFSEPNEQITITKSSGGLEARP